MTETTNDTVDSDGRLAWYTAMADAADRLVYPTSARLPVDLPQVDTGGWDRETALEWLRAHRIMLGEVQRAAADRGLHHLVISLAVSSRHVGLGPRDWWAVGLEAVSRGVEAARLAGDSHAQAFLTILRGHGHRASGDEAAAEDDFRRVADWAQVSGDAVLRRRAVAGLASLRKSQHRYEEAAAGYREMWEATRREGNSAAEAVALGNLAQVHVALGRAEEAVEFAQWARELRHATGNPLQIAYAEDDRARALQGMGEHDGAIGLWEQVVAVYAAHGGEEAHLAAALEAMAVSLVAVGRTEGAARGLRRAAAVLTSLGDPRAELVRGRAEGLGAGLDQAGD